MRPQQQFTSAPVILDDSHLDYEDEPVMNPDPYRVMPTGVVRDSCWRVSTKLRLGYTCSPCFVMNGVYCRAVIDKAKPTGHCGLFIQLAQDVPTHQQTASLRGRLEVYEDKGDFTKGTMVASQDFYVKLAKIGDAWGSNYMFSLSHIEKFSTLLVDFTSVANGYYRRPHIAHFNDPRQSNLAILDGNTNEVVFYADKKTLETLIPSIHNIAYPAYEYPSHHAYTTDAGTHCRASSASWDSNEEGYHSGASNKAGNGNGNGNGRVSSDLDEMAPGMDPRNHRHQHQPQRGRYNRTPPPIPTTATQRTAQVRQAPRQGPWTSPFSSSSSSSSPPPPPPPSCVQQVYAMGMEKWILRRHVSKRTFLELLDCVYNNSLPEVIHIIRSEEFLTLCRDNHLVQPYQRYVDNLRGLMLRGIAPELLLKMLPIHAPETFVHVGNIIITTIATHWGAIPASTKERLASYIKDPSGLLLPIIMLLSSSATTTNTSVKNPTTHPTTHQKLVRQPSRRAL